MIDYGHIVHRFGYLDGEALMRAMIREVFPRRIALVSSFGAESAVLLHMLSRIDATIPVIFLETGKLFAETLAYRDRLVADLRLQNVRAVEPDRDALSRHDPDGSLHRSDLDRCCRIRRIEPLERALSGIQAWISGRKRFHGAERTSLSTLEPADWRLKINPLASWSRQDIEAYFARHALPRHPLEERGYPSIGCAPCTTPRPPGGGVRDGRWTGLSKTECGIHWTRNGRPSPRPARAGG